jgi:predicted NAD/FAD-binding protein
MDISKIQKIAIVGSGIAGLTAAHLLHPRYQITMYEANDYIGGHTHTIDVVRQDKVYAVDTGFIVFNEKTYPHFCALLKSLGVDKQPSNMSFSYSQQPHGLEYGGDSLNGIFAKRRNLLNPRFYCFLKDINRFYQCAKQFLVKPDATISFEDWLHSQSLGKMAVDHLIKPMASAIWSTPLDQVGHIPAQFILAFYANHGLLEHRGRPPWYVVSGGSRSYVDALVKPLKDRIRLNSPVLKIRRSSSKVTIVTKDTEQKYDAVVLACHSPQALALLEQPSADEHTILSSIHYSPNIATLHTDTRAMPARKSAWSSWNFQQHQGGQTSLTYYMNLLQTINSDAHFLVSINQPAIDPDQVIASFEYEHPLYNQSSVDAQQRHDQINGQNRTFFTGAYWGNGFHEAGVTSSIEALKALNCSL